MLIRASHVLLFVGSIFATACSSAPSSSAVGSPGDTAANATFSKYCTGTLKVDKALMRAAGAGAWVGDGSLHAPAGTTFLVSASFERFGGFVIQTGGAPVEIEVDAFKGLVKDTEFTSDCAPDSALMSFQLPVVLLGSATLYANKELTGTACKLDAGTELTGFGFFGVGDAATVSSTEIKAKCGLDTAYSKDFEYGDSIAR